MLETALLFIAILTPLILIHEFGHFVSAKRAGLLVHEFALGFPPRLFARKFGETTYSINILPLGGYVKIFGEEGEGAGDPKSFISLSVSKRLLILFSGVFMNVVFAFFLFSVGFLIGLPTSYDPLTLNPRADYTDIKVQIISLARESPAERAGVRMGDVVESIRDATGTVYPITEVTTLQEVTRQNLEKPIELSIRRGSEHLSFSVVPRSIPPAGEGPIGIMLDKTALVSYPWYLAIFKGFTHTFQAGFVLLRGLGEVVGSFIREARVDPDLVSGPIGIAIFTSLFSDLGIRYLMQFTALISINLAVLNVIPFPALDGGRILFVLIEKIKGKRVDERVEHLVHSLGFAILIVFMIAITIKDVVRYL